MPAAITGVLVAVAIAQIGDLLTFLRLFATHGPAAEANPVVVQATDSVGLPGLALAKLALIVLVVATFTILARSHPRLAATVATLGTVAGIIGAATNIWAMI